MGFLESRILYFSVVLLNLSFSYLSRPFQCHIQQENEVSLQTRGFPSRPEDLDCSPYIKSLSFEGFQPEVWSFLQKGKKKCMKCWHTKNTEKQPTSNSLVSITDYHTPYGPQCPSVRLGEHGLQKSWREYAWSYRNVMRHFPTSEEGSCPWEAAIGTVSHVEKVSVTLSKNATVDSHNIQANPSAFHGISSL